MSDHLARLRAAEWYGDPDHVLVEAADLAALLSERDALAAVAEAARRLPALDLDSRGRGYHVSSDDPDFIALRAALAAYDESVKP